MAEDLQQAIRTRAYQLWEEEGRPEGRSLAHWLRAESEALGAAAYGVLDDGRPAQTPGAAAGGQRRLSAAA